MTHSDLVGFLTARLNEDEEVASVARRVIGGGPWWKAQTFVAVGEILLSARAVHPHVARHDPERVLDEVAAKRAILDAYTAAIAHPNRLNDAAAHLTMTLLGRVVAQLASVYRSHPDWRQEWAA